MLHEYPLALFADGWNDLTAYKEAHNADEEAALRKEGYKRLNEAGCTIADMRKPSEDYPVQDSPLSEVMPLADMTASQDPFCPDHEPLTVAFVAPEKPRRGRPAKK